MTLFGRAWNELSLADIQTFLDQAEDEPLLWEAKGTVLHKAEIRLQVCGFANSHEGGYLILGATRDRDTNAWSLGGVVFPDEPHTWITNIVTDSERGVRPTPDFDVRAWPHEDGHVAVVRVAPTSTPPCITNGTVYERVPGKTQTVRDPLQLASLFARGDQARADALMRADRAAAAVIDQWLPADFRARRHDIAEGSASDHEYQPVRFAVGLAATGNPPNISSRLFQASFAEELWMRLRDRPTAGPPGFGNPPEPVWWSQDALTWRHQREFVIDDLTVVRASWDGAVAAGQALADEDLYPDTFIESRVATQLELASEILRTRLEAFGDVYLAIIVAGGRFPRRAEGGPITMRRGPLAADRIVEHVPSLGRELMRAAGNIAPEPPGVS